MWLESEEKSMKVPAILLSTLMLVACGGTPTHEEWVASGISDETLCGYLRMDPPLESRRDMERRGKHAKRAIEAMGKSLSICRPFFLKAVEQKFANSSDESLCKQHMAFRRNATQQLDIKLEMKRRKVDCWEYGNVKAAHDALDEIAAQKAEEADAKRRAAFRKLQCMGGGCGSRPTSSSPPKGSNGSAPNNAYLVKTEPIVGGALCHYSDGSVRRISGSYCPR